MDSIIKLASIDGALYVYISNKEIVHGIMRINGYCQIDNDLVRLKLPPNITIAKESINILYQDILDAYKSVYEITKLPIFEYIGDNTWQITMK